MSSQAVAPLDAPAGEAGTPSPDLVCETPQTKEGFRAQAERLQALIERTEDLPDPATQALARECIESLLALYGDGLARVLEIVKGDEVHGPELLDSLIHDPTVSGLLLIHNLHPLDLPTRLHQALDKIRPYMESHGGSVELIGFQDGFARLRLKGACHTCPSSTITLQLAVRSALEDACPDLAGFEVE